MSEARLNRLAAVAVACAVGIALALGAIGGASAADLTKKTVRKIATKVVKKQAASLSVAHATSADQLGGFTPGQLQTTEYRYSFEIKLLGGVAIYHFPGLPAGSYRFSYDYRATTSPVDQIISCEVSVSPLDPPVGYSYSSSIVGANGRSRGSASDALTTTTGPVLLVCTASVNSMTIEGQISFERVDTVVSGTAPTQ